MTEQYKDMYQNKYREETAQVHAPLSLIEKTKAAVREEEKRLAAAAQRRESGAGPAAMPRREFGAESASEGALIMQERHQGMSVDTAYENRTKRSWTVTVRKWAYPLTAAAALLILVSVSLTMRGLKSANMSGTSAPAFDGAAESAAVYEEAADEGYEEMAVEAPAAEAEPLMDAYASPAEAGDSMAADMAEGAAMAGGLSETKDAGSAGSADAGQANGLSQKDAITDMAASAEERLAEESAENAERESTEKMLQKNAEDAQKQEKESEQQRGKDGQEDFTIEKVSKRPARFSGTDVKIRRYEGKTFRILEADSEGNGSNKVWEAYVEKSAGEGYVIRGEAESVEDFLAAAYEKLEETEG